MDRDKHLKAGAASRQKGEELSPDSPEWFKHGFMMMDGQVKGDLDGKSIAESYATEFDKDTGDIDGFIREKFQGFTKGLKDESFLEGYNQTIATHLQGLRKEHLEYQKGQVIQKVESNALQKMDNYLRPFAERGEAIPDDGIDQMRKELTSFFKNAGVSNSRFNDLLFASLKRLGDEGNHGVYDLLKRDRPDGTPGMYYIPAWKEKIDAAQVHAQNVAISRANAADTATKKLREDKQSQAMFDVVRLAESDPVAADAMFNKLVSDGLISRADEYHHWKGIIHDIGKREASAEMQIVEVDLQRGIYSGSVGFKQIANANLTPSQKRSLFNEAYRVQSDRRREAAEGVRNQDTIFRTPYFKEASDYIEAILKPEASFDDPFGVGTEFQRAQRATALRELNDAALTVKDPKELRSVSHEIVSRYQERAKDPRVKRELEGAGRIRFVTPTEAQSAYRQGQLSLSELETHIKYYEAQRNNKLNGSR